MQTNDLQFSSFESKSQRSVGPPKLSSVAKAAFLPAQRVRLKRPRV